MHPSFDWPDTANKVSLMAELALATLIPYDLIIIPPSCVLVLNSLLFFIIGIVSCLSSSTVSFVISNSFSKVYSSSYPLIVICTIFSPMCEFHHLLYTSFCLMPLPVLALSSFHDTLLLIYVYFFAVLYYIFLWLIALFSYLLSTLHTYFSKIRWICFFFLMYDLIYWHHQTFHIIFLYLSISHLKHSFCSFTKYSSVSSSIIFLLRIAVELVSGEDIILVEVDNIAHVVDKEKMIHKLISKSYRVSLPMLCELCWGKNSNSL